VHQGVYVNHTGPQSWSSRAWAAVLFYWPAALTDLSAVHLAGDVIHVAIPRERTGARLPGCGCIGWLGSTSACSGTGAHRG
jgi:hypothetical protein